jgi:hypothetical protein
LIIFSIPVKHELLLFQCILLFSVALAAPQGSLPANNNNTNTNIDLNSLTQLANFLAPANNDIATALLTSDYQLIFDGGIL